MTPSELVAVKRTALNAVETLKVAGYAGTGEQLRGAIEALVGELASREELPAPEVDGQRYDVSDTDEFNQACLREVSSKVGAQRKNAAVR